MAIVDIKKNIFKANLAQRACRILPPFLSYRLHHLFFKDLIGSGVPFRGKALFGDAEIPLIMNDIVDVHFALHQTMNYSGMVIASVIIKGGHTVFDIGANIGTETLAMSNLVGEKGKIIAIEADPDTANILRERIRCGNFLNIIVENKAIAKKKGAINIVRCSKHNAGMNFVTDVIEDTSAIVEAITADDLVSVYGEPDFVFMDIEGSEYGFLLGGLHLLTDVRPIIFTEVNASMLPRTGGTILKFCKLLDEFNYTAYDANTRFLTEITFSQVDHCVSSDWLLIPKENVDIVNRIRRHLVFSRFLPRIWRLNPLDRKPQQ